MEISVFNLMIMDITDSEKIHWWTMFAEEVEYEGRMLGEPIFLG